MHLLRGLRNQAIDIKVDGLFFVVPTVFSPSHLSCQDLRITGSRQILRVYV